MTATEPVIDQEAFSPPPPLTINLDRCTEFGEFDTFCSFFLILLILIIN